MNVLKKNIKSSFSKKEMEEKFVIAKVENAKRLAEKLKSHIEKSKHSADLVIADIDKKKNADQLILANKEIVLLNIEKAKLEAELIIANMEKAKNKVDAMSASKELKNIDIEKAKHEAELLIKNVEKAKLAANSVILKIKLAKQSAEIINSKKDYKINIKKNENTKAELLVTNIEKSKRAAELLIVNIDKSKRAAEQIIVKRVLALANEKEKILAELIRVNKELTEQIAERKHAEIELIKAKEHAEECDRLKSAFLSNMSHEIRTPMNGILGFAEILKEPNLTIEEQQDFINTINISGIRMLNTINNIVDISKIESGLTQVNITEVNINDQVESMYTFFKSEAEGKGISFSLIHNLPLEEAILKTDREKIYAVLTNLIKNAIKFTNAGSVEFGYKNKGKYLEFFIKDTGIGISETQKELVFERFRQGNDLITREYEGTGLGLSISKSYVEMLGGRIWVESEEGKGSIFYFTIPVNYGSVEVEKTKNTVSEKDDNFPKRSLKIMIVEDDKTSYSLLNRFLQKENHKVLHAGTGAEAIELCHQNPDIDLILMDVRMPVMDGYEATRQIRQFNKEVIIIMQTAYAFLGDRENATEAGCNDYISKPINYNLLKELIGRYIN